MNSRKKCRLWFYDGNIHKNLPKIREANVLLPFLQISHNLMSSLYFHVQNFSFAEPCFMLVKMCLFAHQFEFGKPFMKLVE